ncbi:hypothetical protein ACLIBG_00505 [Virgibacillus sp. W0181]
MNRCRLTATITIASILTDIASVFAVTMDHADGSFVTMTLGYV